MNKVILSITLVLFVALGISAQSSSVLSVSQTLISSWSDDSGSYSVWEVYLTNRADSNVFNAHLIPVTGTLNLRTAADVWALDKKYDNVYGFPSYVTDFGVAPGGSHKFGYINRGNQPAKWTIADLDFTGPSRS
eukprot:gene5632-6501_t